MIFTSSITIDLLLLAIIGVIVGHTAWLMKRKRFFVFDPINVFWAGTSMILITQPISYYDEFFSFWYSEATVAKTLAWTLFAVVMIIVGYEMKPSIRAGLAVPRLPATLDQNRLLLAGMGLVGLSIFGYLLMFYSAGGLTAWASASRGDTQAENLPGWAYLFINFQYMLPGATAFLLMGMYLTRANLMTKFLGWCLFTVVMLWMLYLGSRSRVVLLAMGALGAVYIPQRKNPKLKVLLPLFVSLMMVAPFLAAYRDKFTDFSFNLSQIDLAEAKDVVLPDFLGGSDDTFTVRRELPRGTEFDVVCATIESVPSQNDFAYGYSFLGVVTKFIPRRIWPQKFYPHGEMVTPIYEEYDLTDNWIDYGAKPILAGPAFSYVAFYWLQAGPLGLALAGLIMGGVFRVIRTYYDREPGNMSHALVLVSVLPLAFNDALSTPIFGGINFWPQIVGMLVVIALAKSRAQPAYRDPRASAAEPEPAGYGADGYA
ncbi:MAG: O-antigen polysaccharide polymerase Wzy [Planctomycetota bacterium]